MSRYFNINTLKIFNRINNFKRAMLIYKKKEKVVICDVTSFFLLIDIKLRNCVFIDFNKTKKIANYDSNKKKY